MADLSKQQQRWLAIGLLLLVCLLLILLLIVPIISKGLEYHQQKQDIAFRLKRYNQLSSSKDAVLAKIFEAKQQFQAQGYLSNKKTESLASAELQNFLKKAIASANGQLTSTQVLPRKDQGAFTRIEVKVRMTGKMEALRSVLYEIETAKPLILVKQLDIRPARGKRNRKTKKIELSGDLNINFQVASFIREKR